MKSVLLGLIALCFAANAFADIDFKDGKLHADKKDIVSFSMERRIMPLMKDFNDEGLTEYTAAQISKLYKGKADLKECVTAELQKVVQLRLDEKWGFERWLRDSLYGIYFSAELVAGFFVAFEGSAGALLVRTILPSGRSGLGLIPVLKGGGQIAILAGLSGSSGLVFIDNGRDQDITLSALAEGISDSYGSIGAGLAMFGGQVQKFKGGVFTVGINYGPQLFAKFVPSDADALTASAAAIGGQVTVQTDDTEETEHAYKETVSTAKHKAGKLNFVAKLVVFLEAKKAYKEWLDKSVDRCSK